MSRRHPRRVAAVLATVTLAAVACTEYVTSAPQCPEFCPSDHIVTIETLLTNAVTGDSSFQGYVAPQEAAVMLAATLPGVDSRPIFETLPIATRLRIDTGSDTTTGPIKVDSARLTLTLLRRDTASHNLHLVLYRLPLGIDSTSTFAALEPEFAETLRVVNLDSLLALSGRHDSSTGDSVVSVDTVRRSVIVSLKFDSTLVTNSTLATDSGKLAFGVRVTADTLAHLALGSQEAGEGPSIQWFNRVDSAGTLLERPPQRRVMRFDGFVFDPPSAPLDSSLTLGGVPSTRALLRVALPRAVRDSSQIIRATLILVPVASAPDVSQDSFFIHVSHLATDLGAKSPIATDTIGGNSVVYGPGPLDTVRIEVTSIVRLWQLDTTAATAVYLRLLALDRRFGSQLNGTEGATFTTIRLYSTRTPAFRPSLRLAYVPRLKFGVP